MTARAPILLVAAFLLLGAGCALDQKIGWPFSLWNPSSSGEAAETSASIALAPGLAFTVRPSILGISGSFDAAIGANTRATQVVVRVASPEQQMSFDWVGTDATGTLTLSSYAGAHAMLLPAFWPAGSSQAQGNGGLWLSREAYDQLQNDGATEWRLGLAENALGALSKAFKTFNDLSIKLSGSATATQLATPFQIRKTGTVETFPLMVDGHVTLVRAIQASSWFADFFILDNPDDPLILKTVVQPVAAPALRALAPADVRWDELGYEITALSRP